MIGSGRVAYKTEHTTYKILHVTNKFAHNNNEIKHMTYKVAHIVDGFWHGANILGCNMNEYRDIWHKEFTSVYGIILPMAFHTIVSMYVVTKFESGAAFSLIWEWRIHLSEWVYIVYKFWCCIILDCVSRWIRVRWQKCTRNCDRWWSGECHISSDYWRYVE